MIDFTDLISRFRVKILLYQPIKKINTFLKCFFFYMAFVGIFGFSLFLAEEQSQIIIWAGFPSQDTGRYDLLEQNCRMIESTNNTAKVINKYVMWLMPPQKWAYEEYHKGLDQYVKNIRALVMAKDPSVYIGQHMTIDFAYSGFKPAKNGLYVATSNKITVILKAPPTEKTITVTGLVRSDPERLGCVIITAE